MNIEKIVDEMIQNRKAIYKLYQEKMRNSDFGFTQDELKKITNPFYLFMDILLEKEKNISRS